MRFQGYTTAHQTEDHKGKIAQEERQHHWGTTLSNNLGTIIKQERGSLSLTLRELAARSGVSTSHLGRIERGERFPSAHILQKIAKPLGFEEDELFTLAGYLSPRSPVITRKNSTRSERLDPDVASVVASQPVEVQRTVIGMLSSSKSMAKGYQRNIESAKYAHRKYPELDEDIITMIDDLMKHPPGRKRGDKNGRL